LHSLRQISVKVSSRPQNKPFKRKKGQSEEEKREKASFKEKERTGEGETLTLTLSNSAWYNFNGRRRVRRKPEETLSSKEWTEAR